VAVLRHGPFAVCDHCISRTFPIGQLWGQRDCSNIVEKGAGLPEVHALHISELIVIAHNIGPIILLALTNTHQILHRGVERCIRCGFIVLQ
jgi:hypothetical protein